MIAILSKKSTVLKECAYAGFFFDGILTATARFFAKDGGHIIALVVVAMLIISRIYKPKIFLK